MQHNDYTTIETVCPECKTTPVIRDNVRLETYCPRCGLIIMDTTIPSITTEIMNEERNRTEKRLRKIWRRVKQSNLQGDQSKGV